MRLDIDINKAVMDGTIEPYYLHAKNYKVKKVQRNVLDIE